MTNSKIKINEIESIISIFSVQNESHICVKRKFINWTIEAVHLVNTFHYEKIVIAKSVAVSVTKI